MTEASDRHRRFVDTFDGNRRRHRLIIAADNRNAYLANTVLALRIILPDGQGQGIAVDLGLTGGGVVVIRIEIDSIQPITHIPQAQALPRVGKKLLQVIGIGSLLVIPDLHRPLPGRQARGPVDDRQHLAGRGLIVVRLKGGKDGLVRPSVLHVGDGIPGQLPSAGNFRAVLRSDNRCALDDGQFGQLLPVCSRGYAVAAGLHLHRGRYVPRRW